jgi:hypothetical protein
MYVIWSYFVLYFSDFFFPFALKLKLLRIVFYFVCLIDWFYFLFFKQKCKTNLSRSLVTVLLTGGSEGLGTIAGSAIFNMMIIGNKKKMHK